MRAPFLVLTLFPPLPRSDILDKKEEAPVQIRCCIATVHSTFGSFGTDGLEATGTFSADDGTAEAVLVATGDDVWKLLCFPKSAVELLSQCCVKHGDFFCACQQSLHTWRFSFLISPFACILRAKTPRNT